VVIHPEDGYPPLRQGKPKVTITTTYNAYTAHFYEGVTNRYSQMQGDTDTGDVRMEYSVLCTMYCVHWDIMKLPPLGDIGQCQNGLQ